MMTPERKLLLMLSKLHVRGYQRLRLVSFIYDLGPWRFGVTHAGNIRTDHGALPISWDAGVLPQHSQSSGNDFFGWADAKHASPSGLARRFVERFPGIGRLGYGPDWTYVGWYSHLLHLTYPDALPFAYGVPHGPDWFLYTTRAGLRIPLPPPGAASQADMARCDSLALPTGEQKDSLLE
jgi:hypothetical protein